MAGGCGDKEKAEVVLRPNLPVGVLGRPEENLPHLECAHTNTRANEDGVPSQVSLVESVVLVGTNLPALAHVGYIQIVQIARFL
jgi:hypothetical protein